MEMDGQWPLPINGFQSIRNGQYLTIISQGRYKWRKICIKSILCLVGLLIWKQIIIFLVSYFESHLERPISSDYLSFVI